MPIRGAIPLPAELDQIDYRRHLLFSIPPIMSFEMFPFEPCRQQQHGLSSETFTNYYGRKLQVHSCGAMSEFSSIASASASSAVSGTRGTFPWTVLVNVNFLGNSRGVINAILSIVGKYLPRKFPLAAFSENP
jgi:hypothetical protein